MEENKHIVRLGAFLGLLFPILYVIENIVVNGRFVAQEFILGLLLYPIFTVGGLYYYTNLSGILKPLILVTISSFFILLGPENIICVISGVFFQ